MTEPLAPQLGDIVYLGSFLSQQPRLRRDQRSRHPRHDKCQLGNRRRQRPHQVRALIGPRGPAGEPMFILKLQQQVFDDPDDLPMNLTTENSDLGRYWIVREYDDDGNAISSKAYVWYGDRYEWFPMGTQGPPGSGADHHPHCRAAGPGQRRAGQRDPGHRRRLPPVLAYAAEGAARAHGTELPPSPARPMST